MISNILAVLSSSTIQGWISAGGVVGILAVILKFLPEWTRVKMSERVSDVEMGKRLRDELFDKLNECEQRHDQLLKDHEILLSRSKEQENRITLLEEGDRRKTVALTLCMNEIHRIDPTSTILLRAKAVLELSFDLQPHSKFDEVVSKLGDIE